MLSVLLLSMVGQGPKPINSLKELEADMFGKHEAPPAGVPLSIDWARGPRLAMGNQPGKWKAFVPWGQLYLVEGTDPVENVSVEIRRMRGYLLSKRTGKWNLVSNSDSGIEGANYVADFAENRSKPAVTRPAPQGIIANAGKGYNYHFWPKDGRVTIDPEDIAGVYTTCQARLVLDDPRGPDRRSRARFVLSMGADYWESLSAGWDNFKTNADVGIGAFKRVGPGWRAYSMHTLTADQLRRTPPPLE